MFLILFHLIIKIVYLLTYLPNTRYVHVIYMCHLYWLNYATEYVVCIALLASILQPIFHVHMCLFRCKKQADKRKFKAKKVFCVNSNSSNAT